MNEKDLRNNKIITLKYLRAKINDKMAALIESEKSLKTPTLWDTMPSAADNALKALQEARMWLGMALQAHGEHTPYVKAEDVSSTEVDPEADTSLRFFITESERETYLSALEDTGDSTLLELYSLLQSAK